MGKREDELRAQFNTLTEAQKRAYAHKIARYRAMGQRQPCPTCGRPTAGFIPKGMTQREVGICTC